MQVIDEVYFLYGKHIKCFRFFKKSELLGNFIIVAFNMMLKVPKP